MDIAILLYDGFTALDAVGPYEVLVSMPEARVCFVAAQVGPVRSDTRALALVADATFAQLPHPDVIVIPGGAEGTRRATRNAHILNWVRSAHGTARWTTSVCTGAFILGAAGLLHGAPATTHWASREQLADVGATYRPERIVRHGQIITAAGVSAGIDMALYLVSEIAGPDWAQAIQLAVEYDPQPPFDSGALPKASPAALALQPTLFASRTRQAQAETDAGAATA